MAITNTTAFRVYNITAAALPEVKIPGAVYIWEGGAYLGIDASTVEMIGQAQSVDTLPVSGIVGRYYLRTTDGTLHTWTGSAWSGTHGYVGNGEAINVVIAGANEEYAKRSTYTLQASTDAYATTSDTALPTAKSVEDRVTAKIASENALTATTLETARDVSITGGATAAAVSFDGSANVALNVTALDASKLTGNIASDVTVTTRTSSDNTTSPASTAFVQTVATEKLVSVMRYKGSVATLAALNAIEDPVVGDVYNVEDDGSTTGGNIGNNYAWSGTAWDKLAASIDLTPFVDLTSTETIGGVKTFTETIQGNISGNAGTATVLDDARDFSITGGATAAAVSFDGGANVALNVTALDATVLSGTASVNTTGNAATATALQTGRDINISGTGVSGTAQNFDGTAAITIPIVFTTQTAGDNSVKPATTEYVDRAVASGIAWTVIE